MSACVSREGEYSDHETWRSEMRCERRSRPPWRTIASSLNAPQRGHQSPELDKIEDRAPHDIDGMIYTVPWAEGVVAGSKRVRRILTTGSGDLS